MFIQITLKCIFFVIFVSQIQIKYNFQENLKYSHRMLCTTFKERLNNIRCGI